MRAPLFPESDAIRLVECLAKGEAMHALAQRLWPINRSISGAGLRQTLGLLAEYLPGLALIEIPTGSKALDWIVPDEWVINAAHIIDPDGNKICDITENNLHLVGYSEGVKTNLDLTQLQAHLHSLPDQPDAIPYITSYYKRTWGFCLSHQQRIALKPGIYSVFVDAQHIKGSITLAEIVLPGETQEEIFFSTYCCHPSMANNELSGPCLALFLAQAIAAVANRRYSYRFVFLPEMIGSNAYLELRMAQLQKNVIAGFNLSCVGDSRAYSYLPSRAGNSLSDKSALHVLKHIDANFMQYHWRDRGSDESNYCAPGVDLPIASLMRSKYGKFPEYHTSLDDLTQVVTPLGLAQSYAMCIRIIDALEQRCYPKALVLGEPQLGRRGLYPSLSTKTSTKSVRTLLDLISYADGTRDLIEIAGECNVPVWSLYPLLKTLVQAEILRLDYR